MPVSGLIPKPSWRNFLRRYKRLPKRSPVLLGQALENSAEIIIARSKGHYLTGAALRVRTGRLRSSVSRSDAKKSGNTYYVHVGTNVFYGKYWETGFYRSGRYFAPRRWLRPAFNDSKRQIRKILNVMGVKLFSGE